MAKTKLNDVATTYIDAKREVLNAAELAKILGYTQKAIQSYLDSHPKVEQAPVVTEHTTESKQPPVSGPEPIKPQFINRTQNGNAGIAICTPQASELSDAIRQNRKTKGGSKFKECTTIIKKQ
jgi:hypothetical protein